MINNLCKCGNERRYKQRNCKKCHASNMRLWRITHRLKGDALKKANARARAGVEYRRGNLIPKSCEVQGCIEKAQKHHEDYSKPLEVRWLCRDHHLMLHKKERENVR